MMTDYLRQNLGGAADGHREGRRRADESVTRA